jgi:hypothetical protein
MSYVLQFSKERRSILPAGDTSQFISSSVADIAILEEPEHLNWYHHGKRWTDKFNHVVGIVHTNYLEYIKREKNGALQAFLVKHINNWVTRAYCDKVLHLLHCFIFFEVNHCSFIVQVRFIIPNSKSMRRFYGFLQLLRICLSLLFVTFMV